jgi:hypothetical protein
MEPMCTGQVNGRLLGTAQIRLPHDRVSHPSHPQLSDFLPRSRNTAAGAEAEITVS